MEDVYLSDEESYSDKTKAVYHRCEEDFERWRGDKEYSEDLISNYIRCYLKGSDNVGENMGTCSVPSHRASSTRTMLSHLMKHLNARAHFTLSEACRRALYKYIDLKGRSQPVNQAKVFSIDEIRAIFSTETATLPQVRDRIIFALGVCTLARSSELKSMNVEDLDLKDDGLIVVVHRKKATVSRATQKIWVNKTFFGWDLLENIRTYLKYIPGEGPLWRSIAPHPKEASDSRVLAPTTIDGIPAKLV